MNSLDAVPLGKRGLLYVTKTGVWESTEMARWEVFAYQPEASPAVVRHTCFVGDSNTVAPSNGLPVFAGAEEV